MATDLMNAHPDLTGLVGECTSSGPGVAQAVENAGKIGKVFTVGHGHAAVDGAVPGGRLVVAPASCGTSRHLGYLTAWAGVQLAEGKAFQATQRRSATDIAGNVT